MFNLINNFNAVNPSAAQNHLNFPETSDNAFRTVCLIRLTVMHAAAHAEMHINFDIPKKIHLQPLNI